MSQLRMRDVEVEMEGDTQVISSVETVLALRHFYIWW